MTGFCSKDHPQVTKTEIIMNKLMTRILNLPGVIVAEIQSIENILILFVKSTNKTAVCPRCGQ
ncbi:MAG TPA: hypothetical protein DEA78_09780, partial [Cyanobacteria bacterium UBA11159]|nr:hypothetical protein [Cyanobacteria bacterium UBA11159]